MTAKQTTIDFDRGEQLGFLRDALIPTGAVRSMTAKTVLGAIDEFCRGNGECFAAQETIAKVSNCSRRTVQRAIDQLIGLGILNVHRRSVGCYGGVTNTYTINWLAVRSFSTAAAVDKILSQPAPTNASLSPTNASLSPTNASLSPTNASLRRTNRLETSETSTTANAVAEILRSSGLSQPKSIELANQFPITIAEADQIVRTFNQNSSILKRPGAICYYLAHGTWPADRVIPAPTREQLDQRAELLERKRSIERLQAIEAEKANQAEKAMEASYGALFDALDPDEQNAIAAQVLDNSELIRWNRGNRFLFRAKLLQAFAMEESKR